MRNNLRNAIHHRPIWLLICVQTVLFLAGLGWFRAASRQGLVTAVREATGCRRWPVPIFNFGTIRPKADSRAINITFCKRRFAMPAESKRIILEMSVLARPDRRSFLVVAGRLGRNLIHRRCRLLWGATEKAGFVRAPSSKPEGEAVSANKRTAGELTIESRVYWGLHSLQIGPAAVGQLAVPIGTKDIHVRIIVSGQILVPVQYLVIPGSPPSTGPPVSCVIWINSPTLQQGFRQGFYDWKSRGA